MPFFATVWLRFLATVIYKLHFLILHCGSIFFATVIFIGCHFYLQLFGSDFFGHCHFDIRRIFYLTLFGSICFRHCGFFKVPYFFQLFCSHFLPAIFFVIAIFLSYTFRLRFFRHSHFYKGPFLSSTVWLRFFGHGHFYKPHFLILHCLSQIFWAQTFL